MARTDWTMEDYFKATNMNELGTEINQLRSDVDNIQIPDGTLIQKGIVQLSDVVTSTDKTKAATANSVKLAYDEATAAKQLGVEQKANVVAALNSIGVSASTSETWTQLIPKIAAVIRATGNATAADLLSGKTASNASGPITGTMPNRGAVSQNITTQNGAYTIPAGSHNGLGVIRAVFANLTAANVREGIDIGGVTGTLVEGPKYATGLVTSGANPGTDFLNLVGSDGSSITSPYVTVTGLSFKPVRVVLEVVTPTIDGISVTTFPASSNLRNGFQIYAVAGQTNVAIRIDGTVSYVTNNGFRLGVRGYGTQYRWHAYG